MTYREWLLLHSKKHSQIINKLKTSGFGKEAIIDYFDYENMRQNEPDFCLIYKENKKCHDTECLNCYLCACPNFSFCDSGLEVVDGITMYSRCSIASKDGLQQKCDSGIHQDCSNCTIPHEKKYITEHFDMDWLKIMKYCEL